MPWHTSGKFAFSPINVTSKKPYRGINTVCLWAAAQAKGYERGEWGTYQQWQERGAQVRKGEKATLVVFWKFANSAAETEDGDEHAASPVHGCCSRAVIPCSMPPRWTATRPRLTPDTPIERTHRTAEQFFQRINARVRHQRESSILLARCRSQSHCRRLPRSSRPWTTTAPARMKPALDRARGPLQSGTGQAIRR